MSPFWKLISSASDATKENRATASMMNRVRKLSQYDWRERESGSVTGAQQCGVTLLRHEGIGAWRQSLTSRSLVNEERFLCACVCPCSSMWLSWRVCEHVDEAAALSISAIYTFLNSGALVKHFHEGNQWQRKEGRKTRREWVKTSQKKVWWSGAHGLYKETLVWKCLKKTCLTVVMHQCVSEWVTEFCRRDASTHADTQFGTASVICLLAA